jgi:hypothetical protein
MASSPVSRSVKVMRERGYRAQVVERFNQFGKVRHDLFGIVDIVCVGNGETIGVQATSGSNVASRIKKIEDSDALADLRDAGWKIVVHGWRKNAKGRWELREVDIS